MKKVLVFGGTSEGRKIAYTLSTNGIMVYLCVATDYGHQIVEENDFLQVHKGRLDVEAMKELCTENRFDLIIDGTHPFATEVSKNIRRCSQDCSLKLLRFERNVSSCEKKNVQYAESIEQCIEMLEKTDGKIFLTTGSKNLDSFCKNKSLKERLVVRVLPGLESLKLCYDNGLEGSQIIAMQGPFSVEMNEAQINDYGVSVLVTKESGKTGGLDSKIIAAMNKKIDCIVIKNPVSKEIEMDCDENYFSYSSFETLYEKLEHLLAVNIREEHRVSVSLVGTGMGNERLLTVEASEAIRNADVFFGSQRLIDGIGSCKEKYPYYLAKDIIPEIERIKKECNDKKNICVLFSGDTGFYSGASSLQEQLAGFNDVEVKVLPGISSMSYLASKTGQSYQGACIISLHGINQESWLPELRNALDNRKKIFMLTSGIDDVKKASDLVLSFNEKNGSAKYKIVIGYRLSYEDELIRVVESMDELSQLKEGLYSLFVSEDF